jgi:alkaline phosphatase D
MLQGDFVYADVPTYHGDSTHAYRRLYRRNYNSPSFRKIYERLRAFVHSHVSCIA